VVCVKRIALFLLLAGCPKPAPNVPDAAVAAAVAPQPAGGPFVLTPQLVDAYLKYQRDWRLGGDGGRGGVDRAQREEAALKASGLTDEQVMHIDEMVSAVVARRMVSQFTNNQGLMPDLAAMGDQLDAEQKKRLEAAMAQVKAQQQAARDLTEERKQFGSRNIDVLLTREADLIKAWTDMMGVGDLGGAVQPGLPGTPLPGTPPAQQ
jgi:hypothetical protein